MAKTEIHFYLSYFLVRPRRVRGHLPPPPLLDPQRSTLPPRRLFRGTFTTTLSLRDGFLLKS